MRSIGVALGLSQRAPWPVLSDEQQREMDQAAAMLSGPRIKGTRRHKFTAGRSTHLVGVWRKTGTLPSYMLRRLRNKDSFRTPWV